MMKLAASFIIACFLLANVQSFSDELSNLIFKKYALLKIFEDCYGKNTVRGMFREVRQAYAKCSNKTVSYSAPTVADFAAAYSALNSPTHKKPSKLSRPGVQSAAYYYQLPQKPLPWVLPDYFDPPTPYGYPPSSYFGAPKQYPPQQRSSNYYNFLHGFLGPVGFRRQKRQDVESPSSKIESTPMMTAENGVTGNADGAGPATPYAQAPSTMTHLIEGGLGFGLTFEKIQKIAQYIQARVGNMSCVMKEMGFLGADMQPDYESIRMRIDELPVPEEVKSDLCEGIDTCKEFSSCLPMKKISQIPMLKELAQPMVFFRCFKGKKLEACMKKDLREKFGTIMEDDMMSMARHGMRHPELFGDEQPNNEENSLDNIFNMIYGFDITSSADDIF